MTGSAKPAWTGQEKSALAEFIRGQLPEIKMTKLLAKENSILTWQMLIHKKQRNANCRHGPLLLQQSEP